MIPYFAAELGAQNRFVSALIVTGFIMAPLLLGYALYKKRGRLSGFAQGAGGPKVAKIFRFVLGGTAIVALLASVLPRESPEAGILLYFILWPLLGLQFFAAFLPWPKFIQKSPAATILAAGAAALCAVYVDIFMLTLAGYIQP